MDKGVELVGGVGGASRWSVCYQRGLPRLIYLLRKSKKLGTT